MKTRTILPALLLAVTSTLCNAEVILTVKGPNGAEENFTSEALAALPQAKITTQTPWTKGAHTYQGVKLSTILARRHIKSPSVKVRALNDYWTSIPVSVIEQYQPLLATHSDGVALTRRNKGPIWVVLPLSERPEINTERFHSYMVWQTKSIEAE